MKKILLFLVITMLPMVASAYDAYIDGIYYFFEETTKTAEVTFYKDGKNNQVAYSGAVDIPSAVNYKGESYSVTGITRRAFYECSGLTSVTIPNSLTSIGVEAFLDCKGLSSIYIPQSVRFIGEGAFWNCNSLKAIYINDIDAWCKIKFNKNSLYGVTDYHLYLNGDEVRDLIIPASINKLLDYTFCGCSSLISVTIPNTVTEIGKNTFADCYNLTSINLPNSITSIGGGAFYQCFALTSIIIPNSIKTIEGSVFARCHGLKSVTIPKSVTYIDRFAFEYVSLNNFTEFICEAENPPVAHSEAFWIIHAMLRVPESAINVYKNTEPWSHFPKFLPIGKNEYNLTYIVDGYVYKEFTILEGDTINPLDEPISITGYTFSGWSAIPKIMPSENTTISGSYIPNKYTIYYWVDGEEYKSVELEYGSTIKPEPAPVKEGYTFSGWDRVIPAKMPARDIIIKGTFVKNNYTLTYFVDGMKYKSFKVEYENNITPEPFPTKIGNTFSGWSEIPETMPAHDVTVTGSFTINKYKLIYKVDGQEYKSIEMEYGMNITPEPVPSKEGFTFSGWSWIPIKMPDEDVTITGTFSVNKYKLTYMIDGETYKTYEVEYGATITTEPAPTKEGFEFSGWDNVPQTMPAENVVITGTMMPSTEIAKVDNSSKPFDIYSLAGVLLKRQTTSFEGLAAGLYIVNGRKVHVK